MLTATYVVTLLGTRAFFKEAVILVLLISCVCDGLFTQRLGT